MSDFIEEFFLRLACETPLPNSITARSVTGRSFSAKSYTRTQAKFEQHNGLLRAPPLQSSTFSKKRSRKPEFDIFVDADAVNALPSPYPKKLKSNARTPLSVRTDLANVISLPSPRQPDRPFPFSCSDPLWANIENYDPRPYYVTPPTTPSSLPSTPFSSPLSPRNRSTRTTRSRRVYSANSLPPPKDYTLYKVLELDSWEATEEQIKIAYKKVAVEYHPDKVSAEQRENATQIMQNVNAAREVLLNEKRRRAYHLNGKLPWTAWRQCLVSDSGESCCVKWILSLLTCINRSSYRSEKLFFN